MADISMCADDDCPKARQCLRHEATISDYQSWGGFAHTGTDGCEFFIPVKADVEVV